jgi:NDP-sugar pyrophosphorylase family protein
MAGKGIRFKTDFETPKPLIRIDNLPMFVHAGQSLRDFVPDAKITFCYRWDHVEKYSINTRIREFFPEALTFQVNQDTRGPSETAFLAIENMSKSHRSEPLLIMDCDFSFSQVDDMFDLSHELGVLTFKSNVKDYSYAKFENEVCVGIEEKRVVSSTAIAGLYFFQSVDLFLNLFEKVKCKDGELFMSDLMDLGIKQGMRIQFINVTDLRIFGTPKDLLGR